MCAVGEEMSYQLSRLGARVILTARNEEKLKEVKSRLSNPDNGRSVLLEGDHQYFLV